jgi:hypothetical protein
MANLQGFQDFVDALGGVTLTVQSRIPIGGITADGTLVPPVDYIERGRKKMNGYHALWYARSRRDSTDYDRIDRQRCLIGAMVRQADPLTVLKNFQSLASATKRLLSTDIPRGLLSDLVELADTVRLSGEIRSLPFVPPLISTADPDFAFIRASVRKALTVESAPRPKKAPRHTTTPGPTGQGGSLGNGRANPARPGATQVVDDVCKLG